MDPAHTSLPSAALPPSGGAHADEIARFDALAADWWNPNGAMAPLHAMNPLRTTWVDRHLPGPGTLLDVGCGVGLASEAFCRLHHQVTGIDAAGAAIEAARRHAGPLPVRYRQATTDVLVSESARFDAVTALEVIEHVPDPAGFVSSLAALARPGGFVFVSTLNRTARSLVVAKWGAEYLLRLLPVGTHQWRRFVTPVELAAMGRRAGLRLVDSAGMSFSPVTGEWRQSRDLGVNYLVAFQR